MKNFISPLPHPLSPILSSTLHNPHPKLTINTKNEYPVHKNKEDDINFSKILNDTEGFDNCKHFHFVILTHL